MPQQIEFFDIPSPCKRICETDAKGYCMGCLRSREERFNWLSFSNQQKRDIIRLCKQRAKRRYYAQMQKQNEMQSTSFELPQLDLFDE